MGRSVTRVSQGAVLRRHTLSNMASEEQLEEIEVLQSIYGDRLHGIGKT